MPPTKELAFLTSILVPGRLGAAYNLSRDWSASVSVTKTMIKTTGSLSTGQPIETSLDPVSIKFGVGYRF